MYCTSNTNSVSWVMKFPLARFKISLSTVKLQAVDRYTIQFLVTVHKHQISPS